MTIHVQYTIIFKFICTLTKEYTPILITSHVYKPQIQMNYKVIYTFQECSNFQAGNAIRSKVKNGKLDVTGIFGSVCKHDIPIYFADLVHGERYMYKCIFCYNCFPIKILLKKGCFVWLFLSFFIYSMDKVKKKGVFITMQNYQLINLINN